MESKMDLRLGAPRPDIRLGLLQEKKACIITQAEGLSPPYIGPTMFKERAKVNTICNKDQRAQKSWYITSRVSVCVCVCVCVCVWEGGGIIMELLSMDTASWAL